MKLSRLSWAIALVLVFLVALLASTPARLLTLVVPAHLVNLGGVSGTIWQGSASRCLLRLPQGHVSLGSVSWTLEPTSLLLMRPRLTVRSEWGSQTVAGQIALRGMQSVDVSDLEASFDAGLLRRFAPVAVEGSFSVQVAQFAVRDGLPNEGEGRVLWQGAAWQSPQGPVPLGSYALDFSQAVGEPVVGEVITLAGPLSAEGQAMLEQRSYSINVLISSEEALAGPISNALSLMAAPEGDAYRFVLEGDL